VRSPGHGRRPAASCWSYQRPRTATRVAGVTLPLTASKTRKMGILISPYGGNDPWWGAPQLTVPGVRHRPDLSSE
jgi:hypothetical protein